MARPFYTYILQCSDKSYYVGHTDELDRRLAEHDTGATGGYTATRRPIRLVWFEEFQTREEAKSVEVQLKKWSRRKKEALINGKIDELRRARTGPPTVIVPRYGFCGSLLGINGGHSSESPSSHVIGVPRGTAPTGAYSGHSGCSNPSPRVATF